MIRTAGWGVLLVAGLCLIAEWLSPHDHTEARTYPGNRRASPKNLPGRYWLRSLAALLLLLTLPGELAMHVAGHRLAKHWEQRIPEVKEFYQNHDLALMVGECIRMNMLQAAMDEPNGSDQSALRDVARDAPAHWIRATSEHTGPVTSLVEALSPESLLAFVRNPEAEVIPRSEWSSFLAGVAKERVRQGWSEPLRDRVAQALTRGFGTTLREALKHDFETGGKAYAAIQLTIAGSLLRSAERIADGGRGDPDVRGCMAAIGEAQTATEKLVDGLRRHQAADADRALQEFAETRTSITRMVEQISALREELTGLAEWMRNRQTKDRAFLVRTRSIIQALNDSQFDEATRLIDDGVEEWPSMTEERSILQSLRQQVRLASLQASYPVVGAIAPGPNATINAASRSRGPDEVWRSPGTRSEIANVLASLAKPGEEMPYPPPSVLPTLTVETAALLVNLDQYDRAQGLLDRVPNESRTLWVYRYTRAVLDARRAVGAGGEEIALRKADATLADLEKLAETEGSQSGHLSQLLYNRAMIADHLNDYETAQILLRKAAARPGAPAAIREIAASLDGGG